jgi:hypothetical protein
MIKLAVFVELIMKKIMILAVGAEDPHNRRKVIVKLG